MKRTPETATRREAASNQYERTARYQAMQKLAELGVVKRLDQLDLYHGRAGDGTHDWRVEPDFDNAGNNTGHHNINEIPALNTSVFETAKAFALARSGRSTIPEVHRITSEDPDALIIDLTALSNLSESDLNKVRVVLPKTLPPIMSGTPLKFTDRYKLDSIDPMEFRRHKLFSEETTRALSERLGLSHSITQWICSTVNTRFFIRNGDIRDLCRAFLKDKHTPEGNNVATRDSKGKPQRPYLINREYLANWFRENHIVGCKFEAVSSTIGKRIDNYSLFDLEKINTNEVLINERRERNRRLGRIACMAAQKNNTNNRSNLVRRLTDDPYIKPEDIIAEAKKTPGFKEIFEADAGNWEKFTLEEHTETTLRLFDHNFADMLPASVLPIMRMALVVHDIGKSVAAKYGDKQNQERYNIEYAKRFLASNNIDESTTDLILAMIGKGKSYAERWLVKKDTSSSTHNRFRGFCCLTMMSYLEADPDLTAEELDLATDGFMRMLEILQICDSAAYTTMAITRRANGIRHRNSGSFDASFEPFHGLTGHRARFRKNNHR